MFHAQWSRSGQCKMRIREMVLSKVCAPGAPSEFISKNHASCHHVPSTGEIIIIHFSVPFHFKLGDTLVLPSKLICFRKYFRMSYMKNNLVSFRVLERGFSLFNEFAIQIEGCVYAHLTPNSFSSSINTSVPTEWLLL